MYRNISSRKLFMFANKYHKNALLYIRTTIYMLYYRHKREFLVFKGYRPKFNVNYTLRFMSTDCQKPKIQPMLRAYEITSSLAIFFVCLLFSITCDIIESNSNVFFSINNINMKSHWIINNKR